MTLVDTEPKAARSGGEQPALRDWVRALEAAAPISRNPHRLLPSVIDEQAQARGDALALISERETLTYRALGERANRYARWALAQDLAKGDCVCLLMPNRPEYMAIWLGLTSVGVVVSLLNTQLRGPALARCIDIVAPRHVIVAEEFLGEFPSALGHLSGHQKIWSHGVGDYLRIDHAIERFSQQPLTKTERRGVTVADRALHI